MNSSREVTVTLPAALVETAVESHGKSVEETLTDALREQMHREAAAALLALRGNVRFEMTWQELAGKDDDEKTYSTGGRAEAGLRSGLRPPARRASS